MKYEAVFGDQKRLNEQNNEMVEVMLWHDHLGPNFVSIKELSRMNLEGAIPRGSVVLAMRRIIKEPKHWTWEDKKAGRLPDVGAELIHKTRGICEFIGVGLDEDTCWALKQQSGSIYIADKSWCQPIETPEERAKREREEWCSKALDSAGILSEMKRYELKRLGEYIGSIHDALQSGELPMPKKGGE